MLILLQDQVRADEVRTITVNVSWRVKVIVHLMPGVPDYRVLIEYRLVTQHGFDVRIGSAAQPRVINLTWEMTAQQPKISVAILVEIPVKRTGLDQHSLASHRVRHYPVLVGGQTRAH